MSAQSLSAEKMNAKIRLMGNPYAKLANEDEEQNVQAPEPTAQQKRDYFRKLQNPYAYFAIFGDPDECEGISKLTPTQGTLPLIASALANARDQQSDTTISRKELEVLLDEVLRLYKPYVARSDWGQVEAYRSSFLSEADKTPLARMRVATRLKELRFSLMPGEKVEHNRAPAARILGELKRLLA